MTQTPQSKLWEGVFGDAYQDRNLLTKEEINRRKDFMWTVLRRIYSRTGHIPKSVLEIGAGQGPNLAALEALSMEDGRPIKLYGTEINQKARIALSENVKTVEILTDIPTEPVADLVFTYGVMIHVHPAHLKSLIDKMYACSSRYLMCCEYFSPQMRPIPYRGEKDALWADDYGSRMTNNHKLKTIDYGFCWKPATGLDNVTYWIFEKEEKVI